MILDELPCCLLLTWARTLAWSSLLLLICVSRKPQYLVLCLSQWHPLPSYAGSWEHTWSQWFTVQADGNCSLIMIISLLETPGPVDLFPFSYFSNQALLKMQEGQAGMLTDVKVLWVLSTSKLHTPVTSSLRPEGCVIDLTVGRWPWGWGPKMKTVWRLSSSSSQIILLLFSP